MNLDDAFRTRRIRSIVGHEPPRPNEHPFAYSVGDRYRVPNEREPIGRIEAITFFEDFLGDRAEQWFDLVVNGEIAERIDVRDIGAVSFYLEGDAGAAPRPPTPPAAPPAGRAP